MVQSVDLTLPLNTRDRELVSVLEDKRRAMGSNQRPLIARFVTPTLTSELHGIQVLVNSFM